MSDGHMAQLHKVNMPGNINQQKFLSHPYTSKGPASERLHQKIPSIVPAKTGYLKQCKRHCSPINFHTRIRR